jgi:hypothetical protein
MFSGISGPQQVNEFAHFQGYACSDDRIDAGGDRLLSVAMVVKCIVH